MIPLITSLSLEKIKSLSTHDLKQIHAGLKKYFYSARINVGLHTALQSKQSLNFRSKINKAIQMQIDHVATADKIYNVIRHKNKISDHALLLGISLLWLSLTKVISGGEALILAYLYWAGQEGGQIGLDKIVPDIGFKLENDLIKSKLMERVDFLVSSVDRTTQKWVAQVIEDGLKAGVGVEAIVSFLKEEAPRVARERADIITETELINAINLVEQEVYKRNGIQKHKWITSEDEKVEELCQANEAAGFIKVGDPFPSGAIEPPQHISCRCFTLPDLPETVNSQLWTGN